MTMRPTPRPGRRFHRFGGDETGAAAVELAIIAPVLMLMLFGIVEFGVAAFRRSTATEAARYGARFAMVRGGDSGRATTQTALQTEIRTRLAEPNVNVTLAYPDGGSNAPGRRVQVTVAFPGTLRITGLFPAMTASATAESVIVY